MKGIFLCHASTLSGTRLSHDSYSYCPKGVGRRKVCWIHFAICLGEMLKTLLCSTHSWSRKLKWQTYGESHKLKWQAYCKLLIVAYWICPLWTWLPHDIDFPKLRWCDWISWTESNYLYGSFDPTHFMLNIDIIRWHHQMITFSALLVFCGGIHRWQITFVQLWPLSLTWFNLNPSMDK